MKEKKEKPQELGCLFLEEDMGFLAASVAMTLTCCWTSERVVLNAAIIDGSNGGSREKKG